MHGFRVRERHSRIHRSKRMTTKGIKQKRYSCMHKQTVSVAHTSHFAQWHIHRGCWIVANRIEIAPASIKMRLMKSGAGYVREFNRRWFHVLPTFSSARTKKMVATRNYWWKLTVRLHSRKFSRFFRNRSCLSTFLSSIQIFGGFYFAVRRCSCSHHTFWHWFCLPITIHGTEISDVSAAGFSASIAPGM